MTIAADARDAVQAVPFLREALRAGVVNYTAAAEFLAPRLDADADVETVAAALRRYAAELDEWETAAHAATVRMRSGVGLVEGEADADSDSDSDPDVLTVGDVCVRAGAGEMTAVVATGDVDAGVLSTVLDRLDAEHVVVDAAGVAGDALTVVVPRRQGAQAVRAVESALEAVPV